MRRVLSVALIVSALAGTAHAAPPPSGGQLLQQVPPPAAAPAQAPPAIIITLPESQQAAPGAAFLVQRIEVTGSHLVPQSALRSLVAPSEGRKLTLADLQALADSITALYRNRGYPFSRAYVPAQTLQNGQLHIAVLEARYDSVRLRNTSRVHDNVPQVVLKQLPEGSLVAQASLDRALLLVSDIPGTVVKGTLQPGATVGTSALLVDVDPGTAFYGTGSIDDYGNEATGRARAGANVAFNNSLGQGDVLSLGVLTSGRGLDYGRFNYALPVYGPATVANVEASALDYRVVYGRAVDLDVHGTAQVYGAGLKQVLLRSTSANLFGQLSFDQTELHDHVGASQIRTDRHTDDWRAGLLGVMNHENGLSTVNLAVTYGHLRFDDAGAQSIDAEGARTAGSFTKFTLDITHLERLSELWSLYVSIDYQAADANLDSSEQFFVGGPSSVRAYDNGLISGSQGDSLSVELRRQLYFGVPGAWQASAFIDTAQLQIARTVYAPGANSASLTGAGLGLSWAGSGGWTANSSLAVPIGGTPSLAGERDSVRFWVQLAKAF